MDPSSAKARRAVPLLAGAGLAVLALYAIARLLVPSQVAPTKPAVHAVPTAAVLAVADAFPATRHERVSTLAVPRERPVDTILQYGDEARLTLSRAALLPSRPDTSARGDIAFAALPSQAMAGSTGAVPADAEAVPEVIYHGPLAVENIARSPAPQHLRRDAESSATIQHRDSK